MNYRIVGADGRTYGPVGLEQIRRWLAEGRVEARTPVHISGAASWTTIGLLPELAAQFNAPPPSIGALASGSPPARGTNGFATAGLVCSLLAWMCCCCLPFSLLGVIFSIIALAQISSQPEPRQEGRVLAIIGLVLSGLHLGLTLLAILLQAAFGQSAGNWPGGAFQ